jgi:L-alanine-DL-glutamate epimerase-like enolase superfamily enzyme
VTRSLIVRRESFPIRGGFRISRGAKTTAEVVVAEIVDRGNRGRGECVPYRRYGETVDQVVDALQALQPAVADGIGREALAALLPAGAARNALDCALWDLEAKQSGKPAWQLAGLPRPAPAVTAFTLSLDSPLAMAAAASNAGQRPLLKVKLGGADGDDMARLAAVRQAAPTARLLVDANEGWTAAQLADYAPALAGWNVALVEQPLPAGSDDSLRGLACPVPLAADESFHGAADIARLAGLYQLVNVKLDKTGGLTAALAAVRQAKAAGLGVMIGCMVGSSLAMAPALLLAALAEFIDLDGPLLLAADRPDGLRYEGSTVYPPAADLWG